MVFRRKYQKGVTIPELMMGIALFAILVSMAAPSFQSLMQRQELNSKLSLLNATLAYARTEAAARAKNVIVCPASVTNQCHKSNNWNTGWLVFVDENDDRLLDANDTLIRKAGDVGSSKISLLSDSTDPIIYNESGESDSRVLKLCIPGANTGGSRRITISNVGSSRVTKGNGC